jgi:hypothetical protein
MRGLDGACRTGGSGAGRRPGRGGGSGLRTRIRAPDRADEAEAAPQAPSSPGGKITKTARVSQGRGKAGSKRRDGHGARLAASDPEVRP